MSSGQPGVGRGAAVLGSVAAAVLALWGCKDDWRTRGSRGTPVPVLEHRPAEVEEPPARAGPQAPAGCSVERVQAAVRPHLREIEGCYRKAIYGAGRRIEGRLVVEIGIDAKGRAKFLGVKEDTLGDEEMTRCIFGVLRPLPYPIPRSDACTVLYPFDFTAS